MTKNLPDRNDPTPPRRTNTTAMYAVAGVVALIVVLVVLHLTGVIGG